MCTVLSISSTFLLSVCDVGRGLDQRKAAGLEGWMQYSALPPAGLGGSIADAPERPQRLREHPDSTHPGNKSVHLKYH